MTDKLRIGINGFGRIGRMVFRAAMARDDLEIVAINDLLPADHLAYLLKYDSVHGSFDHAVTGTEGALVVDGRQIVSFSEKDPSAIRWGDAGVDLVIESTGLFLTTETASAHLGSGVGKVVLSAPPKDDTPVFVRGVNADAYDGQAVISNASCTTNCVAPLTKVVHDAFGIVEALMLTVHATTASQNTVDGVARKDWRFGRGILDNMIPATTGAAKMVGKVIPELAGRINGMAVRVPVSDVSMVDLTCRLRDRATLADIHAAIRAAAEGPMKGILAYSTDLLVSSDLSGNAHSAIFDAQTAMQTGDGLTKLIAWYDNEWGYACRCLDMAALVMAA